MNPRPYRNPGFLISSAVVALLLVLQLSEFTPGKAGADSMDTALKEMQTFVEAYRLVQADYADTGKIDPNLLIQGAIRGMLETLGDPHSRYLPVQDAKDLMIETAGEFGGIGIHIGMENERLSVIAPVEGTPAWRGGVEAGDAIMTIDGRATDTMSLDVAVTLLRGPVGTGVTIEVKRAGLEELIKIPLVRDVIQIHSVRFTQ
ncbi:MAG: PDZ domain-containing protein, partial [Candidatus Hydrogenedentota bacterium]